MRPLSIFLLLGLCSLNAQALEVIYAHLAFNRPSGSPYVETQICVLNGSLHFVKNANKEYQAAYAVHLYFTNAADDTVKQERYTLRSPVVTQPDNETFDLVDIRRNDLPAGTYRIGLVVKDLNGTQTFVAERALKIYFPTTAASFSSPMLVKNFKPSKANTLFTRAGYEVLPYPLAYFPDSANTLAVYYEVYNLNAVTKDSAVFFQAGIRDAQDQTLTDYAANNRKRIEAANTFFASFDITQLKSGRYYFFLRALDKNMTLLGETGFHFTRAVRNKDDYRTLADVDLRQTFAAGIDRDSLWLWLDGTDNLATLEEHKLIRELYKSRDTALALRFLYVFMQHRQPEDPRAAWLAYKKLFNDVEYAFATPVRHGYETDRGRVYMQYGPPDQRNTSTSEPGALPYEVWQYYRIESGQTDVYFIFYLPGLATNDYKLAHSNARGELQDPHWRQKIYPMGRNADPDVTDVPDHFGKRIDDYIPR